MNPTGQRRRRRKNFSSPNKDTQSQNSIGFETSSPSPPRATRGTPPSATLLDVTDDIGFENYSTNPRSFPHSVKQQCWGKAEKIKGRDPDRWRRDVLGNIVFRKLVGCPGCLCHDYDHIIPYSKGRKEYLGKLPGFAVNRSKGNNMDISRAELIQKSAYCRVSGRDMDLLELSAYGNVRRGQESGFCNIQ